MTARVPAWMLIFALAIVSSPFTFAVCSVPQPRLLCAEYSNSQAVVIASLIVGKQIGDNDGYRYSFATIKRFRGTIPNILVLWEENGSGRATFDWKTGDKYLLFLSYSKIDRAWTIDGCGNSGPTLQRSDAIARIQSLTNGTGSATVTGLVTANAWSVGIANVTIRAIGGRATAQATSEGAGRFEFKLPPGTYSFKVSEPGQQFRPGPLSYETPDRLHLRPGGCAQIHFEQR